MDSTKFYLLDVILCGVIYNLDGDKMEKRATTLTETPISRISTRKKIAFQGTDMGKDSIKK